MSKRRFGQGENYITVKSFRPRAQIPKIFIKNNWSNCGPEWSNPIIFRPPNIRQNSTKNIIPVVFRQNDYNRYAEKDGFTSSESLISSKYIMTEIPKTFSKHKDIILPPELSLVPTGSCQNSSLVVLVKSARPNLRNRFLIRSIFSIIQSETSDKISLYFIIGKSTNEADDLFSESKNHSDIV